jgi:hypothetical protein
MSDENRGEGDHEEHQHARRSTPSAPMVPGKSSGRQRSGKKKCTAPDPDDCLDALGQLPGLIAMKLVTTAQANSIRGVYSTILQQHRRTQSGRDQAQLDDAGMMAILRDNPNMLSMLAPLLTEEQIAAIMEDCEGTEDGQA